MIKSGKVLIFNTYGIPVTLNKQTDRASWITFPEEHNLVNFQVEYTDFEDLGTFIEQYIQYKTPLWVN